MLLRGIVQSVVLGLQRVMDVTRCVCFFASEEEAGMADERHEEQMVCRCGTATCYVCRKEIGDEGYAHFCQHFRPVRCSPFAPVVVDC